MFGRLSEEAVVTGGKHSASFRAVQRKRRSDRFGCESLACLDAPWNRVVALCAVSECRGRTVEMLSTRAARSLPWRAS